MIKNPFVFRRGLFDFQVGECHGGVLPFKPADYVSARAEEGVETLVFICKDAYGNAYYDSKLCPRNSNIRGDYLAEAIEAGGKCGVAIEAYFNVLLDDKVGARFTEYVMKRSDGTPVETANLYYKDICPNSPFREIVRDRVDELVRNYDIAGIFFDITYFPGLDTCYCSFCRAKFKSLYGCDIPGDTNGDRKLWRKFLEFRRDSRRELMGLLDKTVKNVKMIPVTYNGSGSYANAVVEAEKHVDILSTEFHAPNYLDGIVRTKWMRSREKPCTMCTPFELSDWGDWSVNPPATMHSVFAMLAGNGAGICVNHVPYPSGEYAGSVNLCLQQYIKEAFEPIRDLAPWLQDAVSVPDIAVLHSVENQRFVEWTGLDLPMAPNLNGACKMLLEASRHFDVISEDIADDRLADYKLLVLPDLPYVGTRTAVKLRNYVRNGGRLLACGCTSLYDEDAGLLANFSLSDLFGADFQSFSPYSVAYLYHLDKHIASGLPDMPILVKGMNAKAIYAALQSGAEGLAWWVEPLLEATASRHVYHHHAHPARKTAYPAAVLNSFGAGQSLYIPGSLFADYMCTASPWVQKFVINCVDALYGEPLLSVKAPKSVQASLMRQHGRLVLHLINVADGYLHAAPSYVSEAIPVRDIKVCVRTEAKKVILVPECLELPFNRRGSCLEFIVPEIAIHRAICIE